MLQSLCTLLFSEYRRRVLELLLLDPGRKWHVREIARQTATAAGTLHKELSRLAEGGILIRQQEGKQVYYSANLACPIYDELASILRKTTGFAATLAQALVPVADKVRVGFVFGSMARGTGKPESDIDVLLIGDLSFSAVVKLLYPCQSQLGREINPRVFAPDEWRQKLKSDDAFVRELMGKPKIFLVGGPLELEELAGDQSR